MPRKKLPIGDDLLDLRARLTEWRKRHPPRSRLPEEVWTAAVVLARKHGLHRTARALPIDYAGLRKRLKGVVQPTAVAHPRFLEVLMAPAGTDSCVEVLRVQVSGAVDWNELFRAWRQGGL